MSGFTCGKDICSNLLIDRSITVLAGLILLVVALPRPAAAQRITVGGGDEESVSRPTTIQIGYGFTVPLAHLAATEKGMEWDSIERDIFVRGDGYALSGTTLNFRAYVPVLQHVDFVADLVLPRFRLQSGAFERQSGEHIANAIYFGKALSIGGRWIPYNTAWGRVFVMVTGGMYQLNFDRFIGGVQVITKGAFKDGASIGCGVEYNKWLLAADLMVRYHRFTDSAHFGVGGLSWLEIGLQVSFDLNPK